MQRNKNQLSSGEATEQIFKNFYALYSLNERLLEVGLFAAFSTYTCIAVHVKYLGTGHFSDVKLLFLGCS